MLLNEAQKTKLIKDLVRGCDGKKVSKLTVSWICVNHGLLCYGEQPYCEYGDINSRRENTLTELAAFYRNFNCLSYISSDLLLNSSLSWVNHWCEHQSPYHLEGVRHFYQRCEIIQEVRRRIKLKTFHVKSNWHCWRGKRKKYSCKVYARNIQEALIVWRNASGHPHVNPWGEGFSIRKIRQISDSAPYTVETMHLNALLAQTLRQNPVDFYQKINEN